jgi:CRISPR type III-associated protein (TIGR04423 family)
MKSYQNIHFNQIPPYLFDGYYWYSDAPKPKLIWQERIDPVIFQDLPFIVEGNFYASAKQLSINVRHIEGRYLLTQYDLTKVPEDKKKEMIYLGHDLNGQNIKLIEVWEEVADQELLAGLSALVPAYSAFAGFTKKITNLHEQP